MKNFLKNHQRPENHQKTIFVRRVQTFNYVLLRWRWNKKEKLLTLNAEQSPIIKSHKTRKQWSPCFLQNTFSTQNVFSRNKSGELKMTHQVPAN